MHKCRKKTRMAAESAPVEGRGPWDLIAIVAGLPLAWAPQAIVAGKF